MTTRNLSALFEPSSVALIGASDKPGSVGAILARNLAGAGFTGRLMMVNPRLTHLAGLPCFPSIDALPETPDLAVIATPAPTIPGIVSELAERGAKACVVISAGLDADARARMLQSARTRTMRIVGPNCLGFLSPGSGINASFAQANALPGGLALVSQSGAIATAMLDWANGTGVGFSHIVSLGDMADVDFGDLLDYLALDTATRAILLYAENITSPRKFMSAARIASRSKPVIMVKAGRSLAGARAAASHTGALAGADAVYDAAIRRAGIMRVETLASLFETAATLASGLRLSGGPLTIVTNGGGLGVLAADELEARGGRLAQLPAGLVSDLDAILPAAWSRGNPVDIIGDADGDRYAAALDVLARHRPGESVLAANCPTGVSDSSDAADAVIRAHTKHPDLPMIACWLGEATAASARSRLAAAGVPVYDTPEAAVRAYQRIVEHGRNQALLMQAPQASHIPDAGNRIEVAGALIRNALDEGRNLLTEPESKRLLAAYGVPVVETAAVATPEEAESAASRLTGPYALKILSRQITHKTDVGGVKLDLGTPAAVHAAAEDMLDRVTKAAPEAHIDGFTVQTMIRRPKAQELIVGVSSDETFGPCILFGHGGIAAETVADRAIGLAPLDDVLARDMIARTRVSRLLAGYRDRPPADTAAIVRVILALSDMVSELPELSELDINPLLADERGVIALDARVVVRRTDLAAGAAMAIRPYPVHLKRRVGIAGALKTIRPVLPEDSTRLLALAVTAGQPEFLFRFHGAIRELTSETTARLAQIDYDREMVLVLEDSQGAFSGVSRLTFDPQFERAELACAIRTDTAGADVADHLLAATLDYARSRGASVVWGDVRSGSPAAIARAGRLGGDEVALQGDGLHRIEFTLGVAGGRPAT